jgi:hypothetical protein
MLTYWLRGFRGADFYSRILGVVVEIFLFDNSDNFHRRPECNERRILSVEDPLWGWLLRSELEEDCAAVVGLVQDGSLECRDG